MCFPYAPSCLPCQHCSQIGSVRRVAKWKGKPFTEVQITAKGEELEQFQELLRKPRQKALEGLGIKLKPPPVNTPM